MTFKRSHKSQLVFKHTYNYYAEALTSFINSTNNLQIQMLILINHVLHESMSLYRIFTIPIVIDVYSYLGNRKEYI